MNQLMLGESNDVVLRTSTRFDIAVICFHGILVRKTMGNNASCL